MVCLIEDDPVPLECVQRTEDQSLSLSRFLFDLREHPIGGDDDWTARECLVADAACLSPVIH